MSGDLGGLLEDSLECSEFEGRRIGEPCNCGDDFDDDEYTGDGDLVRPGVWGTDMGDRVRPSAPPFSGA